MYLFQVRNKYIIFISYFISASIFWNCIIIIIISFKTIIFLFGEKNCLKMVKKYIYRIYNIMCEIISVHFKKKNCAALYLYFYVIYLYYSVNFLFIFLFIK